MQRLFFVNFAPSLSSFRQFVVAVAVHLVCFYTIERGTKKAVPYFLRLNAMYGSSAMSPDKNSLSKSPAGSLM